jgi:hypothetical protein
VILASVIAIAVVATPSQTKSDCMLPPELQKLWPDPQTVVFRQTTLEERAAFARLVPALLAAAEQRRDPPPALVELASAIAFQLEAFHLGDEILWTLREQRTHLRGAGAYVIRTGPAANIAVQAPHAYFDLGTGELAAELFACAPEGLRPRILLTNTAHRFRGRPGEKRDDPDHPADVAHNPEHLFQIVTDLLARERPGLRIFQLHGFGEREARPELAAVVSGGSRAPGPWTRKVAASLGEVLGEGVRLFPDETELLGATRNAQARLLEAHPRARFVHLELSPEARRALKSPDRIEALARALFSVDEVADR